MTSRAWREANGRVFSDRFAKLRSDRQVNSMQRQFLDRNPVLFVTLIQYSRCYFDFRENLETGDPRDIMFRRGTKTRTDFDFSRNLAGTAQWIKIRQTTHTIIDCNRGREKDSCDPERMSGTPPIEGARRRN